MLSAVAQAQGPFVRPQLDWRTIETPHFRVHFPRMLESWATDAAARLESARTAVSALVGHAPTARVTVLVEDPANLPNGFAFPVIDAPLIVLWPPPAEPADATSNFLSRAELLVVHEFAHIAHLAWPSRSPRQRLIWSLLPGVDPGAVLLKAPRWVAEGYATYIEGKVTGRGRPHGVTRPAFLREWALEGRLPSYSQLSSARDFAGGSMAYLAGSAFLEWLVQREGEESLTKVWRRMSARVNRSFDAAFAGVFGELPDELYGRFTVEVTQRALAVRAALDSAGVVEGELIQKRRWSTGEPALSRDGSLMAVQLGARGDPARVVVWRTVERVDTGAERRARERALERDPQDVLAVQREPRPKRVLATLRARHGIAFDHPRFLPGTSHILVSHLEPMGDGSLRPDLFVWNFRTRSLRRVTRGSGVRYGDPSPDGRHAVGVRCLDGSCDLVRVDLASGRVDQVLDAPIDQPYYRPRFSPDGRSIVVTVMQGGRWRLALTALDGAPLRLIDRDDGANRFDAAFTADGRSLIHVSDAGGITNLERVELATSEASTITRVTSAVFAPEPHPTASFVYFLQLHAKGIDVRRLQLDSSPSLAVVRLDPRLSPAAPVPVVETAPVGRGEPPIVRPYGLGPRSMRVYPGALYGADGAAAFVAVSGNDPVGRLSWLAQAGIGERSTWRGGSLAAVFRRFTPSIEGSAFYSEQRPSLQRSLRGLSDSLDAAYAGASLSLALMRDYGSAHHLRVGASVGQVDPADGQSDRRTLGFADYRARGRVSGGGLTIDAAAGAHFATGSTAGAEWWRTRASLSAVGRAFLIDGRVDLSYGVVRGDDAPFERFVVGGVASPFVDPSLLAQRVVLPAVPVGFASGRNVATARLSTFVGPVMPFYWWVSAADRLERWQRIVGVERTYSLRATPALEAPSLSLSGGAAFSIDEPRRHKLVGWFTVRYAP